jgi:predicted lipid-binding transport protein (Tim44 family)
MEQEGLGFRFYAGMAGIVIAGAIAALILMLIFSRALYAWGFFGMFLVLAVMLLVIGWLIDRREARRYEAE